MKKHLICFKDYPDLDLTELELKISKKTRQSILVFRLRLVWLRAVTFMKERETLVGLVLRENHLIMYILSY